MNNGIQPTVELATNNGNGGFYPYPVYPMMSGGNGGNGGFGFGGDSAIWLIVLLALIWGNNGNNGGGIFGGGNNFDDGYAWLSNGQKDIMNQTSDGFNTLHLSNQLESTQSSIASLSNQLCNCCADMQQTVNSGFFNSEVANCNRQMANMNQNFTNQLSLLNSLNDLNSRFSDCCCENRLGLANLTSTVISENCADREALSNGIRDIVSNQTANTQRILDQLCQDKIDAKNEKITDLQREILMKDLQASQIQQTAELRADNVRSNQDLVNLLNTCPIPSTPVYGRTAIFTCPNNNGCGCNNGYYNNQFI